ncbi:MAG: J domain-containing protein [Pseudomonadota bacterium]
MAKRPTRGRFHGRVQHEDGRKCAWPGCTSAGEFRAPRSREAARTNTDLPIDDYLWFCLDHVREYNQSWDFFKGLNPEDQAAVNGAHPGWDRPTWAFGRHPYAAAFSADETNFQDPHGVFHSASARAQAARSSRSHAQVRALKTLGLEPDAPEAEIKKRYRELIKRYHPDAHAKRAGDNASDERRLKSIIDAYNQLKPLWRSSAGAT